MTAYIYKEFTWNYNPYKFLNAKIVLPDLINQKFEIIDVVNRTTQKEKLSGWFRVSSLPKDLLNNYVQMFCSGYSPFDKMDIKGVVCHFKDDKIQSIDIEHPAIIIFDIKTKIHLHLIWMENDKPHNLFRPAYLRINESGRNIEFENCYVNGRYYDSEDFICHPDLVATRKMVIIKTKLDSITNL